jgi:hypothetical protein
MKTKLAFTALFLVIFSFLKGQTVAVSPDKNNLNFVITQKTTDAEIQNAISIFKENSILAYIKTSRKKGQITKLSIEINSPQGFIKYHTSKTEILTRGVLIMIDKAAKSGTTLSVGPVTAEH